MAVWQYNDDIYVSPKDRYYSIKFCCGYSKIINVNSGRLYQFAETFACIWIDAYTGIIPRARGHFQQLKNIACVKFYTQILIYVSVIYHTEQQKMTARRKSRLWHGYFRNQSPRKLHRI